VGLEEGSVTIYDAETSRDVTFYLIEVAPQSGEYWKIARRYSQFKDLHDRLSSMFAIGDSSLLHLPPKRIFNNNDPGFIQKRRAELQEYLRSVILNLHPPCPQPLKAFLTDNLYDFRKEKSSSNPASKKLTTTTSSSSPTSRVTKTSTSSAMSYNSTWGEINSRPLIDIESPKPEATPKFDHAFSPTLAAPPNRASSVAAPNVFDAGLDAFGMPSFGDNAFNTGRGTNVASASAAFGVASRFYSEENALPSSFSAERKSQSKWFDQEPAKRCNAFRLNPTNSGLVRDALSNGALGKSVPANGAPVESRSSAGSLSPIISNFPDLHRQFQKQISSTYSDWKKKTGPGTAVFVNDLISF